MTIEEQKAMYRKARDKRMLEARTMTTEEILDVLDRAWEIPTYFELYDAVEMAIEFIKNRGVTS